MNLDDLLKSIREEDDDSKGGKDLDDLLESIREEGVETDEKLDEKIESIREESAETDKKLDEKIKSIREEDDDSKGRKINGEKFLKRKTFENPLKGQRYTAPSIPGIEKSLIKPIVVDINLDKIIPDDNAIEKLIPNNDDVKKEIIEKLIPPKDDVRKEIIEKLVPNNDESIDKLIPKDEDTKEILEKLDELIDVIKKDNELEKDEQDYDRKKDAKEKRQKREKRIEVGKIFSNAGSAIKKSIGGLQNVFNTILRFLGFTLLGQIVKFVTDFLGDPKNKKFLEDAQNFIRGIPDKLREVRDKLIPVVDWFKEQGPKIAKFAEDFRKLIAKFPFLGQYFKTAEEKEAEQKRREQAAEDFGPFGIFRGGGMLPFMGTDTVPAMLTPGEFIMSRGAVNMFGADTMMAMNKAGGGTNIPKFGLVPGYQGGGFVITREQQALLDAISFAEGTKKSYGTIYGGKVVPELEQGKLTLDQVYDMMMTGKLNGKSVGYGKGEYASVATGRYQLMPETLRDIQRNMKLSGDTLLTPDMQDKMILDRVTHFRGVSPDMLRKEGLSTRVLDRLAPEFASFPFAPLGNQSYYGQPVKSPESIREAYKKSLNIQKTPPPALPAPPPVIPSGISFGPGFDSNERAQSERLNLINLMHANRAKQSTNRFSGVDLDFIFNPIREFLGVDTPNVPTKTSFIVLPTIQEKAQQPGVQVGNEIPNFKISSGVRMRGLVGKALGIEDLVS